MTTVIDKIDAVSLDKIGVAELLVDKNDLVNYLVVKHEQDLVAEREKLLESRAKGEQTRSEREAAFRNAVVAAGKAQYGKRMNKLLEAAKPLYGDDAAVDISAAFPDDIWEHPRKGGTRRVRGINLVKSLDDVYVHVCLSVPGKHSDKNVYTQKLVVNPTNPGLAKAFKDFMEFGTTDAIDARLEEIRKGLKEIPMLKRTLQARLTARLLEQLPKGKGLLTFLNKQLALTLSEQKPRAIEVSIDG